MTKVHHKTLNLDFVVKTEHYDNMKDDEAVECFESSNGITPRKFLKSFLILADGELSNRKKKRIPKKEKIEVEDNV